MANPYTHVVRQGDHLYRISDEYNVEPNVILDANPFLNGRENTLFPGEELTIPVRSEKEEPGETEKHHPFDSEKGGIFLRLRLLKADGSPLENSEYLLELEEGVESRTGSTDGKGQLEEKITAAMKTARITVRIPEPPGEGEEGPPREIPVSWDLSIGGLHPLHYPDSEASCISGVQQRLNNLRFDCGSVTGAMNDATKEAVRSFRKKYGMAEGDQLDRAVLSKLAEIHDQPDSLVERPAEKES